MVHQQWHKQDRVPWSDRFNAPTVKALRSALSDAQASLFDDARSELLALTGGRESIVWQGDCWRWTLVFQARGRSRPLAVIIPNPEDLQLALVVEPEFLRRIWDRRMKRALRDGLELAAEPFDTEWGIWSLQSSTLLEELIDLLRDRLTYLKSSA